jgi:hypothetical protein
MSTKSALIDPSGAIVRAMTGLASTSGGETAAEEEDDEEE